MLLRGLDALARRYGRLPGDFVPGARDRLCEVGAAWFDLLLSWACVEVADDAVRSFVRLANARGDLLFPTVPITSLPR